MKYEVWQTCQESKENKAQSSLKKKHAVSMHTLCNRSTTTAWKLTQVVALHAWLPLPFWWPSFVRSYFNTLLMLKSNQRDHHAETTEQKGQSNWTSVQTWSTKAKEVQHLYEALINRLSTLDTAVTLSPTLQGHSQQHCGDTHWLGQLEGSLSQWEGWLSQREGWLSQWEGWLSQWEGWLSQWEG